MGLFDFLDSRAKVSLAVFARGEVESSLNDTANGIRQLLDRSGSKLLSEKELQYFCLALRAIAMSLAPLDDDVQRAYRLLAAEEIEKRNGVGAGLEFQERGLEYVGAYYADLNSGKPHLMVNVFNIALTRLLGTSDESTVKARLGFVMALSPSVMASVKFYREIKVVS